MLDTEADVPGPGAERLIDVLRTVVAPLVEADEGELYLLEATSMQVRLHLRGKFSGCPGNNLVAEEVILPVLRREAPDVRLDVSSGPLLPQGAERVSPRSSSPPSPGEPNPA